MHRLGLFFALCSPVFAGPYQDHGIPAERTLHWGQEVINYWPASGAHTNANEGNAIGAPDGSTVSLGDLSLADIHAGQPTGTITLQFDAPFHDGPDWDLAVFENAFQINSEYVFAELAYVEVSSDGVTFARFPSISLSTERLNAPTTSFSGIDPTDVHNLAGKHIGGLGTPFDLSDLRDTTAVVAGNVQLNRIQFVRIVDIPGSESWQSPLRHTSGALAFPDSLGNPILDPWDTSATGVAGFDLDAIGGRYVRDTEYLEIIQASMFQAGTDLWTGDLNGDGMTDGEDFNLWNTIEFVDPRPVQGAPLPEPSIGVPLLLGALLAVRRLHDVRT